MQAKEKNINVAKVIKKKYFMWILIICRNIDPRNSVY